MFQLSIAEYATGVLVPTFTTCREYHADHGWMIGTVLKWYYSEPTTVFGSVGDQEFAVCRDLMMQGLRAGAKSGFPRIGTGHVQFQVLPMVKTNIAILLGDQHTLVMDRDLLTSWCTGTFTHVPADREEKVLDIDATIKQLLSA